MANFAGKVDPFATPLVYMGFSKIGVQHRTAPELAGITALDVPPLFVGNWADGPSLVISLGGNDEAGRVIIESTSGMDWFELVHVLPRETVDFGNIVTLVQRDLEVFSAFRDPISFTDFVNNAGLGVDIPDLPAPVVIVPPFTSFLDPSSTRLNPVKIKIEATPDGPAFFDATLDFTFAPGGVVYVRVTGIRVALFLPEFNGDVTETLSFMVDVQQTIEGQEQRVSSRQAPRQSFEAEFLVDGTRRRRMRSLLFGWLGRTFGLPLWHEQLQLSATVALGATSATVAATAGSDLRVGGLCLLYKNDLTFDVLEILTVTSTAVTFVSATQNAYAVGDLLMPLRITRVTNGASVERMIQDAERVRINFEVLDNETGAPTASTGSLTLHLTRPIIDSTILSSERSQQSHDQRVIVVDGATGIVDHDSHWLRSKHGLQIGLVAKTLQQVYDLRRLLLYMDGRRRTFWSPSFANDLQVTQNLVSAGSTITVENVGYSRYVAALDPRAIFRIRFTDGTSLIRRILSAAEASATEEILTLDAAWPSSKTVAQVRDIQFLQLARLDSDRVRIKHGGVGRARVVAPARLVFDTP